MATQQPRQPSGFMQPGAEPRGSQGSSKLAETAEQAAENVKSSAIAQIEEARNRAQGAFDEGKHRVAERIRRAGSAFHSAGEKLREEDQTLARYADMASERIDRVASYVGSSDVQRIVHDVEDYARRNPLPFYGGALLLGLAVGRVLKSTASTVASSSSENAGASNETPSWQSRATESITPQPTLPVDEATRASPGRGVGAP